VKTETGSFSEMLLAALWNTQYHKPQDHNINTAKAANVTAFLHVLQTLH